MSKAFKETGQTALILAMAAVMPVPEHSWLCIDCSETTSPQNGNTADRVMT
jgi:hypothetical protein